MAKQPEIDVTRLSFEGSLNVFYDGKFVGKIKPAVRGKHGLLAWLIVDDDHEIFYSPHAAGIELARRAQNK